jgi:hypothetical protein
MIEIIGIFFTALSLVIFSNFSFSFYAFKNKYDHLKLGYSDSLLINIIINCNFLLLFSLFKFNLNYIFILIIFSSLILLAKHYKSYYSLLKTNIYQVIFFASIFYAMSIYIAQKAYLDWDGLAHWVIKAQVFFQGGEYKNLESVPFNYYPHLGPYLWAFFWKNSYMQYEYLGRIFYIFIFLISIFSLISKLSSKFAQIEKFIIVLSLAYLSTNFYLFSGYQEYLIFFSFFCFSRFMFHFLENNKIYKNSHIPEIMLIGVANLLLWTKQEGFFYYIIISIIFLLHGNRNFLQKYLYLFLFLIFIFLFYSIKNYYFGGIYFNENIINNELAKNLNFIYLFSKIILIFKYILISFIKYPIWIVIFLSFLILEFKFNFFVQNKFFYTFFFLCFLFVIAIYLQTTISLTYSLPITLNRLIFAISGFFIFFPVVMLNKLKK